MKEKVERKNFKFVLVALLFIFLVLNLALPVSAQSNSTVTTLNVSSGSVPAGSVVVMTASVVSGSTPVTPGMVTFCDTTAARCADASVLGVAWLNSSGTATFRKVLSPGAHSLVAYFAGTTAAGASVSAAVPVTVTATLAAPTTTINSTGSAGNYQLTGTVTTNALPAPTGTITFSDSTNGNVVLASAVLGTPVSSSSFTNNSAPAVNSLNQMVITGDFNNNGLLDYIVITQGGSSKATVMLGNGDGTFTKGATYSAGSYPVGVVTADFNGDGNLDIAIGNSSGSGVTVLLGNGDGTFTAAASPAVSYAAGLTVGDFNGDGIPDLAVSNNANDYVVTILFGNGDGTFTAGPSTSIPQWSVSPEGLVAADFNGDGKTDLAVTSSNGYTPASYVVSILLGNGDGTFAAGQTYNADASDISIVAGDFNGDGYPDLAVVNYGAGTATILLGKGDGSFTAGTPLALGKGPYQIIVGDFNHDGVLDLATANATGNSVGVLLGNGDGTFAASNNISTPNTKPLGLAAGDFTGNGLSDFVTANNRSTASTVVMHSVTLTATGTANSVTAWGDGSHSVVAVYSGDGNYPSATSPAATLAATPLPAPQFSLSSGSYSVGQLLGITDAIPGTAIYYTLDGSIPTAASTLYSAPFALNVSGTVSAIAVLGSVSSSPNSIIVTINKLTPVVNTWPTASAITYGQTLASSTLTGGSATVPGSFSFTTPSTAPNGGTAAQPVIFTPADTTTYNSVTGSVNVTVNTAAQTITVNTPAPASATMNGQFTVAASASSGLSVSYGSSGGCVNTGATYTMTSGTTACTVLMDQAGDTNYSPATEVTATVLALKAVPTVTAWPAASAITYGQTLASSTLSGGSATVAGGFAFTTPSTAPTAGTALQSVTFTPADLVDYTTIVSTVSVTVNKATPTILIAPTASNITYGQTLASSTLSGGSATVAGGFAFTTPSTAPTAGTAAQSVTFTPTDLTDYTTVVTSVNVTVNPAAQTITVNTPAPTSEALNSQFTVAATASSGLSVSYGSSGGCTNTGATYTMTSGTASCTVTFSQGGNANYLAAPVITETVTAAKGLPTINNWPTASSITYGQALSNSTLSGGSATVAGTFAFSSPTAIPAAGSATQNVTFMPTDTADYGSVTGSVTVTVTPAALRITASNQSKVYGTVANLGSTAFTSSGLVNGDTISSVTLSSTGSAATASVAGSPYAIVPSSPAGTGFVAGNYNITYVNGSLTVTAAPLTITASAQSKTYGVLANLGTTAFTASGLANGDTVGGVTLTSTTGAPATAAVGSYAIVPSAATGGTFTASNYNISYVNGTLTVTPAALVITPNAQSKTYGTTLTLLGTAFTSTGLANGQTIGSVTLASAGTVATASVSGSPYPITASNATGGTFTPSNYSISYVPGVLTVTQATPTVSAWPTAAAITYGSTLANSTLSGGTASVGGSFAFTTPTLAPAAGTAAQSVTFTPTDNIDYKSVTGTVNVTVNKAALTVTANNQSKVFGQTMTVGAGSTLFTSSGLKNSDAIASVTLACTGAAATSAVTTYAITPSAATGSSFNANNYTITYVNGTLTVTKAPLTITASNQSKAYGVTLTLGTTLFTSSGLVNGNTLTAVTLTSTGSAATATVAGSPYPIVPSAATGGGGFAATNYAITYVNGNLTVTKATSSTSITSTVPVSPVTSPVTVKVNFAVTPQVSGTATGNVVVTINDGSGVTCTGTLSGGSGNCSILLSTKGTWTLTATYGGDSNFQTSSGTSAMKVN